MAPTLSCDNCEELLPGYVLHALEPNQTAAVAEHLSTCARCQASMEAYEAMLHRLAEAVPSHLPPPELRQRLLEVANADLTPITPAPSPSQSRRWRAWVPRWGFVLTVANVLLFLGTAWFASTVWRRLPVTGVRWEQMTLQLGVQRQILVFLTSPDTRRVLLRSDAAGARARGILLLQPTATTAALVAEDLPALAPNRVYQLWLLRDNARDNGGIFRVDKSGYGMLVITAPHPLTAYRAAGITEEPAGGSPGPTSPRLIGGRL